jgi:hypothetical protein
MVIPARANRRWDSIVRRGGPGTAQGSDRSKGRGHAGIVRARSTGRRCSPFHYRLGNLDRCLKADCRSPDHRQRGPGVRVCPTPIPAPPAIVSRARGVHGAPRAVQNPCLFTLPRSRFSRPTRTGRTPGPTRHSGPIPSILCGTEPTETGIGCERRRRRDPCHSPGYVKGEERGRTPGPSTGRSAPDHGQSRL